MKLLTNLYLREPGLPGFFCLGYLLFSDMLKLKHLSLLLLISAGAFAQTTFPELNCETLSNKKITLPKDMLGKRTVVGLAFSPKTDKSLKVWSQPLYNALMVDGMGGMMSGNMYNANVCYVGMLRGINKLAMSEMKERSRENVDKKLHDFFMISDQNVNEICDQLKITEKSEPHFFVLDENGKILYHTWGDYSDAKLNQITEKLLE